MVDFQLGENQHCGETAVLITVEALLEAGQVDQCWNTVVVFLDHTVRCHLMGSTVYFRGNRVLGEYFVNKLNTEEIIFAK